MDGADAVDRADGAARHGRLYLVPAPLDFGCDPTTPLAQVLPAGTLEVAARLQVWIAENAKTLRGYLKRVDAAHPLAHPLQALRIEQLPRAVHKHGDAAVGFDARALLAPALAGDDIGLASEAGMPAVADPGSSVVRSAHDLGIAVVPLIGPVAPLLALAASGMNGQSFAFVGYLPTEPAARAVRIRELEALALGSGQTQLFIETPYRNSALLHALLQTLQPRTQLAVASGLTLATQAIASRPVAAWRRSADGLDDRVPAVFAIGR
ncbi:MAG: Tetrapyrrole methylase family protein [Burkholderiaceae bacterium]|jgi:16S rRNA (cytidine1402-2'-O)-methyltransferase|nr:MAG: Tetrapyrrole methylase family protein [Burkholderiaceae bacterium]